ncbi:MAG: site-specific integrase [Alphaproteobacteria bacterium]|nr:site-specific integrase [Alphaproteobacteria bacterium]MBU0804310.1 site-specific integrase [Alphaproteobacteria bacterium]MBU0871141.1 site-specific integrase [Alphaproteobacteria bacterium]MBU1400896.1 site-specific integrase [Alphaproteobacteria bacterium]MBU1592687.1 site-specific integrase [Alphaproteobacteria bacterium]
MKRKGTLNHQFTQRIPADVRVRAAGLKLHIPLGGETVPITLSDKAQHVRLSLRSSEPSIVKQRHAEVAAYLETVWQALRASKPIPLSHRQAVALAKEVYLAWATERNAERTLAVSQSGTGNHMVPESDSHLEEEAWESVAKTMLRTDPLGREPEEFLQTLVRRLLLGKGIAETDEASLAMVTREFVRAFRDAFTYRQRQAGGDYGPDPKANRFPDWPPPSPTMQAAIGGKAKVSLKGLVEDWWKEAERAGRTLSTYESYAATVRRLSAILGHDDAVRVTPADVVAYKDHRLEQGVSAKTVGDSDIAGLRSIFGWAVANMKLPSNPADGIKVTRTRTTRTRSKELTTVEAKAVLTHALQAARGSARPKTHAARRWVPWLCAYTGARLGEMVQLRKEDIRKDGEVWVATITPEAGTVKDKEVREVVLHAHLVETGFIDFVQASTPGHLFLTPNKDGSTRGVRRSVKNRVTEFVREVVTDRRVAPNHGWRHLFKTIGREASIADSVLDGICGHASRTVGGSYGGVSLKAQKDAIAKFPRFEIDGH